MAEALQEITDLRAAGRLHEALDFALKSLRADPSQTEIWHHAGFMAMMLGNWPAATTLLEQALAQQPANPNIRCHCALALMENNRLAEAYSEVRIALAYDAASVEAMMTEAEILSAAGYYDLALAIYKKHWRDPHTPEARSFGQAAAVFLCGDHTRGFGLIAHRPYMLPKPDPVVPLWDGKPAPGLKLAVLTEQGHGDFIMLARYFSQLAQQAGDITVFAPEVMSKLMRSTFPGISIRNRDYWLLEKADYTAYCSIFQFPALLNGVFNTLAQITPYLKAEPAQTGQWQERICHLPKPRIGLVWGGNTAYPGDHKRSLPRELAPDLLQPVLDLAAEHLIAMQLPPQPLSDKTAFNAAPHLRDFADTAALIANLDLLITTDTAVAHLAGALGTPVWTMLGFNPDWRWLVEREDSIWYPSMRLFRQPSPGDWGGVVTRVAADLKRLLAGDRTVLSPRPWTGGTVSRHPQAVTLPGLVLGKPA